MRRNLWKSVEDTPATAALRAKKQPLTARRALNRKRRKVRNSRVAELSDGRELSPMLRAELTLLQGSRPVRARCGGCRHNLGRLELANELSTRPAVILFEHEGVEAQLVWLELSEVDAVPVLDCGCVCGRSIVARGDELLDRWITAVEDGSLWVTLVPRPGCSPNATSTG